MRAARYRILRWLVVGLVAAIAFLRGMANGASIPYHSQRGTGLIQASSEALAQRTIATDRSDDPVSEARTLYSIASTYEQQGNWQLAGETIERAIALLHALERNDDTNVSLLLAQSFNIQGTVQLNQGRETDAFSTWQQAESAYRQANDDVGILGSQINQSIALQRLGLYRQASILLGQVAQLLATQPDQRLKITGLWELGNVLRLVGDLEQSQTVLQQSLALAEQVQPSKTFPAAELASTRSGVLLSLGTVVQLQGETDWARSLYDQAIATAPSALTRVQAQVVQFALLLKLAQWTEAQTLWAQLRPQLADLPLDQMAIYAYLNVAQSLVMWMQQEMESHLPMMLTQDIAQILATAAQQSRELGDRRAESYALGYLGHLYETTGQWRDARQLTEAALRLAQEVDAPEVAYLWQWQLGRLWVAQEKAGTNRRDAHDQAIAAYTEAASVLQSLRSDLVAVNSDVQFSFRDSVEPVYRQFVELLLRSPDGEALSQTRLQQARQVIESLQLAELDNFFREACLNVRSVAIDALDTNAAVVYPIILPDQLAVIVSLPNQPLHYHSAPLSEAATNLLLDQMRQSLRPNSFLEDRLPLAQRVYDVLLRPVEAELTASHVTTLVFVPDGTFRSMPMAALHDGQRYLIERYSIALTPGLQLLQSRSLEKERLRGLIAGLSQTRQGFPALPNVITEVEQIGSEISAQVLLNETFTSDRFQSQIDSKPVSIVHLATHGQFSSSADETFILTWDGRINVKQLDQLLQSREGNLNPIELLVLSACQTAAGDRRAALGMAGVAVRSGARSTLASLWSVSDRSTALLMVSFYQEFAKTGVSKAEALRRAQLSLLHEQDYQSPYYWAPFVLLGNWL